MFNRKMYKKIDWISIGHQHIIMYIKTQVKVREFAVISNCNAPNNELSKMKYLCHSFQPQFHMTVFVDRHPIH